MVGKRVISKREERLAAAKLLVELARATHRTWLVQYGRPFGSEVNLVFVGACVAIGDYEDRPMTASDVATYIDMPRATVQRKLRELEKRAFAVRQGNRYVLSDKVAKHGESYAALAQKVIQKAHTK